MSLAKHLIFTSLLIIVWIGVNAQSSYHSDFYNSVSLTDTTCSKSFSFSIRNLNFFKNNEYFNDYNYSQPLLGTILEPAIKYRVNKNVVVTAGIYLQKYFGENSLDKIKPLFRFNWQLSPGINLIFGDLNNGLNHRLIEPLYQFDRHYTHNDEEGLQILINKENYFIDFWLNYEKNSRPGDKEQELLQVGWSSSYALFHSHSFRLDFNTQAVFAHKGGQDLSVSHRVQTIMNSAFGLDLSYKYNTNWDLKNGIRFYRCDYAEISPSPMEHVPSGRGYLANLYVDSEYIYISGGYWNADGFISDLGEPLYQSKSYKDNSLFAHERNMIFGKIGLKKDIAKGVSIGVRLEGYRGFNIDSYDYFYGIHILVNDEFFIAKVK